MMLGTARLLQHKLICVFLLLLFLFLLLPLLHLPWCLRKMGGHAVVSSQTPTRKIINSLVSGDTIRYISVHVHHVLDSRGDGGETWRPPRSASFGSGYSQRVGRKAEEGGSTVTLHPEPDRPTTGIEELHLSILLLILR